MDGDDWGHELALMAALPGRVSLPTCTPLPSPASRRLSSCFSESTRTLPAARKKLAWVSLQGRLVGAEEAASARAIGGGLSPEEAAAWELFTPLQRVLLVAVVAAAAAESKKARRIAQLQNSVDLRDEVLLDMQQKLDDLCEQLNSLNEQAGDHGVKFSPPNGAYPGGELVEAEGVKSHSCDHQVCKLDSQSGTVPLEPVSSNEKMVVGKSDSRSGNTLFISNTAEQEERRMSDLSDFCPSVTSSMDIQFSSLAAEDLYNLRKECEEKDEIIKELNASAHASNVASSKRIAELEDIVRRKNMVITKLKKDMVVLEQKVIQLTRMQRPSFLASNSSDSKVPVMSNNLIYDMSSSSPSSSDSDSPAVKCEQQIKTPVTPLLQVNSDCSQEDYPPKIKIETAILTKNSIPPSKSTERQQEGSRSPLKENCLNCTTDSDVMLRPRKLVSSEVDVKRLRRRLHQDSRRTAPQRRWI